MSVRKAHNAGRNHERNVLDYYQRMSQIFDENVKMPLKDIHLANELCYAEIGHEKAQSVIDSITSSYAAEGQAGANPMLAPQGPPPPLGGQPGFPPPPFGFPGGMPPPPFNMPGGPQEPGQGQQGPGGGPPPGFPPCE